MKLIAKLKALLNRRKEKNRQEDYECGYDYAASFLLSDTEAMKELEHEVSEARTFGDHDPFDQGIERAMEDFQLLIQNAKRGVYDEVLAGGGRDGH